MRLDWLVLVLALLSSLVAAQAGATPVAKEPEENPAHPCYKNGGCDSHVKCRSVSGKAACPECPKGFTGEGKHKCFDIDECGTSNGHCDRMTRCINTEGSYHCSPCPQGYTGDGLTGCTDRNECTKNNGGCDNLVKCKNYAGGRSCGKCPKGYEGDGEKGCTDKDECLQKNGGCDEHSTCTNTPGKRICSKCIPPYIGDGQKVDSCKTQEEINAHAANQAKERSKVYAATLASTKAATMYTEKYFAAEARHREQEEELARKRIEEQKMDNLESRLVNTEQKAIAQRDKRHASEAKLHQLHASIILKKAQTKVSNIYEKTFAKIAHLKREARRKARERAYLKKLLGMKLDAKAREGRPPAPGFEPCVKIPNCHGVPQGIVPIPPDKPYIRKPSAVVGDAATATKAKAENGDSPAISIKHVEQKGIGGEGPKTEKPPADQKSYDTSNAKPKDAKPASDASAKIGGKGGAPLPDQSVDPQKSKETRGDNAGASAEATSKTVKAESGGAGPKVGSNSQDKEMEAKPGAAKK